MVENGLIINIIWTIQLDTQPEAALDTANFA